MPIRFRCVYCNQLLGISRRKAGTVVRCTTCEGQLIVPDPSAAETEFAGDDDKPAVTEAAKPAAPPLEGMFEQSDFDAVLEPFQVKSAPAAVAKPPAPPLAAKRPAQLENTPPIVPAAGVVLSRKHVTIACTSIVLGLGLAFAGGLWLGLSLR